MNRQEALTLMPLVSSQEGCTSEVCLWLVGWFVLTAPNYPAAVPITSPFFLLLGSIPCILMFYF